jgi:signal transduction histidine kinase
LEAENHRLDTVIATQQEITSMEFNLNLILDLVAKRAHELSLADGATVEIAEDDDLVFQAATGLGASHLNTRVKLNRCFSGQSYLNGQILYCQDTETDDRVDHSSCRQLGVRSILVVPLPLANGEVAGVLKVFSRKVAAFNNQDIQSLQLLAGLIGMAIRQVREAQFNRELKSELARRDLVEAELQVALSKEKELFENTNQFISLISHDFRTPLTAIQSSTELLQYYSDRFTPQKKAEIYERVHSSVRHLTELLDNIALLSKVSVGKLRFQPEPISPEDLCKSLLSEIEPTGTSQPRLVYRGPTGNHYLLLDKNLTRLILWHILNNALQYSPANTPVELTLAYEAEAIVFTVKDRGNGIPAQDRPRIFEIFFRGSNISNVRGSGMGLTIVRYCLDLHGGTIEVASEVGQGTVFTIKLPTTYS